MHDILLSRNANFNTSSYAGDIQLRSLSSFVNNMAKWGLAQKNNGG